MEQAPAAAGGAQPPAAKKQRLAAAVAEAAAAEAPNGSGSGSGLCAGVPQVRAQLLSPESREALRVSYQNAQPYTHMVLRDVFDQKALRQVREEIISNLQATYKETDLFKVFQTGDLAVIDRDNKEHAEKLPTLLALRDTIYSDQFRAFVQQVTGCGELSDKTDCSCNTHAKGCHLLCHDDVIGTRIVSYIIYLTDPDQPWKEEDGGALELYPCEEGKAATPSVSPTVTQLPTWNSMAFFTVQPGRSFHAVQEVFSEDNPRLSIQGWYHAPGAPHGSDQATLQQLVRGADTQQEYEPIRERDGTQMAVSVKAQAAAAEADGGSGKKGEKGEAKDDEDEVGELPEEDVAFLLRYINPVYLGDQSWSAVQSKFKEDGSVQLRDFLKASIAGQVLKCLTADDKVDGLGLGRNLPPRYGAGVRDGWAALGPTHKQRYLQYGGPPATSVSKAGSNAGSLLAHLRDTLFKSAAFARLLRKLTTLAMTGVAGEVRRFRPGLDYTVAHYGILTKEPRLDCVLCFCDTRGDAEEAWAVGEVGGFEAYLLADEEEADAAEVYRQGAEESGVLNVSAAHNSLNLVLRDEGLMRFVKYVSAAAPSSRLDVAMEYVPEDDEDDDDADVEEGADEEGGGDGKEGEGKDE